VRRAGGASEMVSVGARSGGPLVKSKTEECGYGEGGSQGRLYEMQAPKKCY